MTVEPEVTEYEYCFYQPDLVEFIPVEKCESPASSVDCPASSECQSTSLLNTGLSTAGEWWVGFSTLGILPSSCICLSCVWFAEYENR